MCDYLWAGAYQAVFVQCPCYSTVRRSSDVILETAQKVLVTISDHFLSFFRRAGDQAVFPGLTVVVAVEDILVIADHDKTAAAVISESTDHVMRLAAVQQRLETVDIPFGSGLG